MPTKKKIQRFIKKGNVEGVKRIVAIDRWIVNCRLRYDRISPLILACELGNLEIVEFLFNSEGSTPNIVGRDTWASPLHHASKFGHVEVVHFLVKQGVDIEYEDRAFTRALFWASQAGHLNVVEALLKYGANVDGRLGRCPLHGAAANGHVAVAQALIESGADVNATVVSGYCCGDICYHKGKTAFHMACECNGRDVLQVLLNSGADVNNNTAEGMSPLHLSINPDLSMVSDKWRLRICPSSSHTQAELHRRWQVIETGSNLKLEVVKLLLIHGADVNATHPESGNTVLDAACLRERKDIVEVLITHGAEIEKIQLQSKIWLLFVVSWRGFINFVDSLVKCGTPVDQANRNGRTPLLAASQEGHVDVVNLLLKHGANVNKVDLQNMSALQLACAYRREKVAETLLQYGADVLGGRGEKLLCSAAEQGLAGIVKLLLEYGANVNATNELNSSALQLACTYRRVKVVETLLQYGADVPGGRGENLLCSAAEPGVAGIVKLLLDYGANVNATNEKNFSALKFHCRYGKNQNVGDVLLHYGVKIDLIHAPFADGILGVPANHGTSYRSPPLHHRCCTCVSHAIKLHAAGLGPEPTPEVLLRFKEFQEECLQELTALHAPINSKFTYFDVLMKDPSAIHDPLVEDILRIDDHNQRFPIYGLLLDGHLSLAWEGRLLNRCSAILQSSDLNILLPELVRLICTYLDRVSLMAVTRIVAADTRRMIATAEHMASGLGQLSTG